MSKQDTPETDAITNNRNHSVLQRIGDLEILCRRLERQRDELLAALKLMRDAWDMSDETKAKRERRAKAWIAGTAAIAAATREKA